MDILNYHIPIELIYVFSIIYGVIILCLISFKILDTAKPSKLSHELLTRTISWFYMVLGITVIVIAPPIVGTLILAFISFVALREMLSIGIFRASDRIALFAAYLTIPVQYFFAYTNDLILFLIWIPLFMFIALPFLLVLKGQTQRIGRSMSLIPAILVLTVFMISHIAMLFGLDFPNSPAGPGGLIIYLIMLTEFNDVFQFVWGKSLGRHKIIPKISPNKTWEGFLGGVFSTIGLAYLMRFLTPFEWWQALIIGAVIALSGFMGDLLISAIKRDLKLKDTSDIIPGHGGAMDRLDSLAITAPIFYHTILLIMR